MNTHSSIYILLLLLFSCGTIPKLDGKYTSAVDDNASYFASERYNFNNGFFDYNYSTDVGGEGREGNGIYHQKGYKTILEFSEIPNLEHSNADITKSPPNTFTFTIDIDVNTYDHIPIPANIFLNTYINPKKYYSSDIEGKVSITLANDITFPIQLEVRYISYDTYTIEIDSPENHKIKVYMQPEIGHLITSVTKEKDIRKKGSYIYINGKKFKKITK